MNKKDIYIFLGFTFIIAAARMTQAAIPAINHEFAILILGIGIGVVMNKAGYSFRENKALLITCAFATLGMVIGNYFGELLYA